MNLIKDLNKPQLKNWVDKKFRDGLLIKSPYDKQAHKQILNAIENNGNGGCDSSIMPSSIIKRLDEIQATIEQKRNYAVVDKDALREELKFYMADKNLTIQGVADLIEKDASTVWKFLQGKVKPQDRTIYRIKKLLRKSG